MHTIIKHGKYNTEPGDPYLLGAVLHHNGCNFALFSKNATDVTLVFFNKPDDNEPSIRIPLDKKINRTGDVWHIFIHGIEEGQLYGYLVDGPYWPEKQGHRFNVNKLLIDPYAQAVYGSYDWSKPEAFGYIPGSNLRDLSFNEQTNFSIAAKGAVIEGSNFDWEGDKPLNIPMKDSIIYEMHIRAFTYDESSKVKYPGTYKGLIEKIPYLKDLGITTVELLPVHEFHHMENARTNPETGERLYNFWGYSTLGFFAPDAWYATKEDAINAVYEFKEMVKAFHDAGIEVVLDVVYNHTGEGNEYGPTIHFKGLDNSIYYMTENGRYYKNFSGCGNTLNCNHPVVKKMIKDSLRYWVIDMHVDGFRFDLAAILGRDKDGHWVPDYSVLGEISHDPILSNTKLIAEGWDAAGLYQVGGFPPGWAEWNASFRDDVRSFVKGDPGIAGSLAMRITGSSDLFYFKGRSPYHSINFITAHDGFTLYDLVSYNEKHNEQNGENNSDGNNNNISWNCGVEGDTDDVNVINLRERLMKNFMAILLISQGTPMILSGDELKFTKKGNNNTYCHDNKLNWIDWTLLDKNPGYFSFCRYMINFRKRHPVLRREGFLTGVDTAGNNLADISWHGTGINSPDWSDSSRVIAFMMDGSKAETGAKVEDNNIYVAINSYWEDLDFHLPEPGRGKSWYNVVNTAADPGFFEEKSAPRVKTSIFTVQARSLVILIDK